MESYANRDTVMNPRRYRLPQYNLLTIVCIMLSVTFAILYAADTLISYILINFDLPATSWWHSVIVSLSGVAATLAALALGFSLLMSLEHPSAAAMPDERYDRRLRPMYRDSEESLIHRCNKLEYKLDELTRIRSTLQTAIFNAMTQRQRSQIFQQCVYQEESETPEISSSSSGESASSAPGSPHNEAEDMKGKDVRSENSDTKESSSEHPESSDVVPETPPKVAKRQNRKSRRLSNKDPEVTERGVRNEMPEEICFQSPAEPVFHESENLTFSDPKTPSSDIKQPLGTSESPTPEKRKTPKSKKSRNSKVRSISVEE